MWCRHNATGDHMTVLTLLLGVAVILLAAPAEAAGATPRFPWPHGARAAISLAYDDALDSQLDIAIPALNRAALRASFYLQLSNPSVDKRMAAWRAVARRGHELGNHTLFHQCSSARPERAWVVAHRNLETTTVAQVKDQALLANTMLHAIDGRRERTFTAPCGDLQAGGQDYLPAIAGAFVAIKAGAGSGVAESMWTLDAHAVPVLAPVGLTGKQLIAIVKEAGAKGTMASFTFHGIGGDYLATSSDAHRELLTFLATHRKEYWTATFIDIMQHVKAQRRP